MDVTYKGTKIINVCSVPHGCYYNKDPNPINLVDIKTLYDTVHINYLVFPIPVLIIHNIYEFVRNIMT